MARSQREKWRDELDALLAAEFKATSSELHALYGDLLRTLKTSLADYLDRYDSLTFSKRLEVDRLFLTAGDLATALTAAGESISGYAYRSGVLGYQSVWYSLDQVEQIRVTSMGLDRRFIESLIASPVAGATLSQRLYRNRQKLANAVNAQVARGVAEGRGYAEIARRINDTTEASYRQALTIARTEGGRVRSEATQRGYEDAAKTVPGIGKRWVSTLDGKTRDDHRFLDGQIVPFDGQFVDQGGNRSDAPRMFGIAAEDINCRCTTEPIIDGESSSLRRDNSTGETIEYVTYTEWAKSL